MVIAVASEGNQVSAHFGHCEGFMTYMIEEDKPLMKKFISNPGHRPGFLPVFLKENGVNVIIAGGMGETAQQLFAQNGIKVIVGIQGYGDEVVQKYLTGNLQSLGSVCRDHKHEDSCHS